MNNNRRLTELFAKYGQMKADNCKDCGGSGSIAGKVHTTIGLVNCNLPDCTNLTPTKSKCTGCTACPTCQKWRELAKLCWHERVKPGVRHFLCTCGKTFNEYESYMRYQLFIEHIEKSNPTYTIQTIKLALVELGEWEGFISYLNTVNHKTIWDYAAILTTDSLLLQPAINFMEGLCEK